MKQSILRQGLILSFFARVACFRYNFPRQITNMRRMVETDSDFVAVFPELVVFDLDACLWLPEMYTLSEIPSLEDRVIGRLGKSPDTGCAGVKSGYEVIRLFPDAIDVLRDFYEGKYPNSRLAIASSADTPLASQIARATLSLLEIAPGVTMKDVFCRGWETGFEGNILIGRQPPLSSNKAKSHFPILQEQTGIAYTKMIFFDDCGWDDHCAAVAQQCPGVVTQRTPRGLQRREWEMCLRNYQRKQAPTSPSSP